MKMKMTTRLKFIRACRNAQTMQHARMLWDWADCRFDSEEFWGIMLGMIPWAFAEPGVANSIWYHCPRETKMKISSEK